MKQPGEELQETLTELDDRAVVDYLIKNPEFFIRNARAVEAIRVPHPVRGTVSLVEWHMARARNHIHVLEENMALLNRLSPTKACFIAYSTCSAVSPPPAVSTIC